VAEAALDDVRNKPLEAADSLSQHAKEKTIGVMERAEIIGDAFIYHGWLWDHNYPEKVEAISSAQELLGSSMNARASGHITTVDGQRVYWVDSLELLGGCILFSELATYRDAQLLEARSQRFSIAEGEPTVIAASASTDASLSESQFAPTEETEEWNDSGFQNQTAALDSFDDDPHLENTEVSMDPALQRAFANLGEKLDSMETSWEQRYADQEQKYNSLLSTVSEINQERQTAIQAAAQKEEEDRAARERQLLVEALGTVIDDKIAKAINPRNVPSRPGASVVPLINQQIPAAPEAPKSVLEVELGQVDFAIERLRAAGGDTGERMKLLEQRRSIVNRMQHA
jgi:hypothetical protein